MKFDVEQVVERLIGILEKKLVKKFERMDSHSVFSGY